MSWLHCVVSRKKSLMSLRTNSRLATGRKASSVPTVRRHSPPRTNRSAPSCAFVNPVAYSWRWSSAPRVTAPAAVVQSKTSGRGSLAPCGKHQHGEQGEHGERGKQRASPVDHAVGRQDRHGHERHHPRGVQQRLAELGQVEPEPVHGRRDEQVEVLREEEARQRRDHVRQHEDADEGEEHDAQNLGGEERPDVFHSTEVLEDQVEGAEHADPECHAYYGQREQLARPAAQALLADPLQGGPPLGLEHAPQRRLGHGAPSPPWPNTSASSRTWAPPVSLRNSSSRLASPARCCRRRSSTVPSATILPCWMMATRSHIASATSSVWVLMSTVPPRLTNCRKMSFSSRAAFGSSPTIGSSTTMYSGRWINALEMISFW